jgi:DNA-binding transcriptional LysR family regulator
MIDQRLVTFLTICKTKNFTRAAGLLHITQPAVTKHIKSLEDDFDAPLFLRKGRTIELTPEGKILLESAKAMETQAFLTQRKIKNSKMAQKHYIIGATLTTGEYVLPPILGRFRDACPDIDVSMQVHNTQIITGKLSSGEIDLGLVEGPFDKSKFDFYRLREDELVFVVSPQNPLAYKTRVDVAEVLAGNLILREEGSGTRKVFEDRLLSLGISLSGFRPFMEIGSIGAIKSLVGLNLGSTVISKTAVQNEILSGALRMIPIRRLRILRSFDFIFLKTGPSGFLKRFISFSAGYLP